MSTLVRYLLLIVLISVMWMSLTQGAKDSHFRLRKKYDPTQSKLVSAKHRQPHRSPRQTLNEERQYYPCITCFQLGTRERCTTPYCPEGLECDKFSRRCHKKAKIPGRTEAEEEGEPAN